jgi:hypothetical protein
MSEFLQAPAETPPDLALSIPLSSAPLPFCKPHALSTAVRYFNRDEPLQIFAAWLNSFDAPHFPRERLHECCRDFVSTTLPSWTIACAPDALLSTSHLTSASFLRPRPSAPLQPHSFAFSLSCVPSDTSAPVSVLPFHRCCAFEWKDDAAWSFQCSALPLERGQQSASWIVACSSSNAVHSFVITGRVGLGSLSCFRSDMRPSSSPAPPPAQISPAQTSPVLSSFARYVLVAVPLNFSGSNNCSSPSEGSKKWLSDLRSSTQLECLRSSYPDHELSVPFSSPFMFQQQRRVGFGQLRSFSSAFGQGANKRARFGASPR